MFTEAKACAAFPEIDLLFCLLFEDSLLQFVFKYCQLNRCSLVFRNFLSVDKGGFELVLDKVLSIHTKSPREIDWDQ